MTDAEDKESTVTGGEDEESAVTGGEGEESTLTGGEDTDSTATGGEDADSTATGGEDADSTVADREGGGPTAAGRRKMLLWGGGVLLVAVAVVVVVVLIVRGGGGSLPDGPLGLVPDDAWSVHVFDVEDLLSRDAPDYLADGFEDSWEDRLDDIGISIDDVDTLVQANGDDGFLAILDGEFDFEEIKDELDDADYDDDEYQGSEMWAEGQLWVSAAAILEGRGEVVLGSVDAVEGVLKSLNRGSGSLLQDDDNDVRRALEKPGQGWYVLASEGCSGADLRGCEALASAVSRGSESYLVKVTSAFLFRNERTAESEMRDLEDYLDDELPRYVDIEDVSTDGMFVIVITTVDEDDLDSGVLP